MLIAKLASKQLIAPPKWLADNTAYLCMMGSTAYGVSGDSSDMDLYGYCLPPKHLVFPHLAGEIPGFSEEVNRFEQWSQHHVVDKESRKEYDLTVYSIVKFFRLCMDNNPNMVDALFVPRRCILHTTEIGEKVRENRHLFLHKGSYHKFRGYAYSQMNKIKDKTNSSNPKRKKTIEDFGYDTKFAYHVVRLACEAEQILVEHDLDITRDRELLKSIRRGEWTLSEIESWFSEKEKHLETLYANSSLRHSPDVDRIKSLLLECLEQHYGTISKAVSKDVSSQKLIEDMKHVIEKYERAIESEENNGSFKI